MFLRDLVTSLTISSRTLAVHLRAILEAQFQADPIQEAQFQEDRTQAQAVLAVKAVAAAAIQSPLLLEDQSLTDFYHGFK